MAYLEEFKDRIEKSEFPRFLQLWEEYANSDNVDPEEFKTLLRMIKSSDLASRFGQYVETALPVLNLIKDEKEYYEVLKLLIDIQTTNSPMLADLSFQALKKKFGEEPLFKDRIRMVQLRSLENFQGAITNYELLSHMAPGKFVFHTGGWGTGEIIDLSNVREQVVIEFENVGGRKDMSFENAYKTLVPLPDDHFLARRFGNPDLLEKEARESPQETVRLLLRDLGPKTAAEIKDELCEWVIPEPDWTKWWQGARAKIKKDTMIESPDTLKDPFRLHLSEVTHEERMQKEIHGQTEQGDIIQTTYNYVRDFPNMLKKPDVKKSIIDKLLGLLSQPDLPPDLEWQLVIFLEQMLGQKVPGKSLEEIIKKQDNLEKTVNSMEILAFKKRALVGVKEYSKNWPAIFLSLLFSIQQNPLRDYLLQELNQGETAPLLKKKIGDLLHHPTLHPDLFVWYFQKVVSQDDLPYSDKLGQCNFLESFLILFSKIESKPEYRDLTKKMYNLISGKRFAIIRQIIEGSSLDFIKEFLLLVSKCQTLNDHDHKILRSLAEVVHPSLSPEKGRPKIDLNVVWTTEEGYLKTQERVRHLGTVEIVDNAREIEAARALGDLRENAEYKSALERRSRLQSEMKTLSDLLSRARIITKDDVPANEIGIGSVVELKDGQGKKLTYSILGPWDADPDQNVLSFQSKLAQAMTGFKKRGYF